jgi:hypothetical protein
VGDYLIGTAWGNPAQYLPERHRMMQSWANYLDTLREKAREEKSNA